MEPNRQIGLPERRASLRSFDRAGNRFDDAGAVHEEARQRLLERLAYIRVEPGCIVDLGTGTGPGALELAQLFPTAEVIAIDRSAGMLERASARFQNVSSISCVAGDAEQLPLQDNSVDLIFANLLLPWCAPDVAFGEMSRVLREGGLLSFTTVGPDTLAELRTAWAGIDDTVHVHGFIDMHDIGDLALRAGLSEPVMDVDRLQVTYSELAVLMEDLRSCGATNVAAGRRTTLTGRERWGQFAESMASKAVDGRFGVTVELVFGQAWGTNRPPPGDTAETTVSLEEMSRQLRRG